MIFKAKIGLVTFLLYFLKMNFLFLTIFSLLLIESLININQFILIFLLLFFVTLFNALHVEYVINDEYIALKKGILFESRIYFKDIVSVKEYSKKNKMFNNLLKKPSKKIIFKKYLYKEKNHISIELNNVFFLLNTNDNDLFLKQIYLKNNKLRKD